MRRIFVDLEMHPILKIYEGPGVWRQETIEIGAVMLDENLEEIGSFKEYVKPVFSDKVYGRILKLTVVRQRRLHRLLLERRGYLADHGRVQDERHHVQ